MSPSAKSFEDEAKNISSRKLTKTAIKWAPKAWDPLQAQNKRPRTPDLSKLIQEVVSQKDWKEGNSMVFVITGKGERDAFSFDAGRKKARPMLRISSNK